MSFISDRLGAKPQSSNSQSLMAMDNRGNEFSRRSNPELFNARMRVKQDIPLEMQGYINNQQMKLPIPENMAKEYNILLTSQRSQEGQLAAMDVSQKIIVASNLKCAFIKMQMREFECDAYNPYLADLETQRESHWIFESSRNGKDIYNEGKTQETYAVESRIKQEYTERQLPAKKAGILGFLKGGNS